MAVAQKLRPKHTHRRPFKISDKNKGLRVEPEAVQPSELKRNQIIDIFKNQTQDISEISKLVESQPSYTAEVLQREGLIENYFDLYTPTGRGMNVYSENFENVLPFRDLDSAQKSVEQLNHLYEHYQELDGRAGQHQAMVYALVGFNRARFSGKSDEAKVFADWIKKHLK